MFLRHASLRKRLKIRHFVIDYDGFLAVADSKITSQITIEKGFMQSIWLKEYTGQEKFGNSIKVRTFVGGMGYLSLEVVIPVNSKSEKANTQLHTHKLFIALALDGKDYFPELSSCFT